MLKVYENSENYTAVVVRLRNTFKLEKLDNLVGASFFGSQVLVGKDYPLDELYLYLPAGTVISQGFLSKNNLFAEQEMNEDKTTKGYFSKNCRVRAVKFRGNTSTGILLKLDSLQKLGIKTNDLVEGQEFNEIHGVKICEKYIVPVKGPANTQKSNKIIDNTVDSKLVPEHPRTLHLLKYLEDLDLNRFVVTIKLHGTSGRCYYALVNRKLSWKDKLAKLFGVKVQEKEYKYVVGSRHVIKSIGFNETSFKSHFYKQDLWTQVCKEYLDGKLTKGEAVYFELIGKTYQNGEIQTGYTYGFNKPEMFIYRISHISEDGHEVDLSWPQVKARANELGVKYCPEYFSGGSLYDFCHKFGLNPDKGEELRVFGEYMQSLLDTPSVLDKTVVEEGFVIRQERYPKPHHYKIKSPMFLLHETKLQDDGIEDIES